MIRLKSTLLKMERNTKTFREMYEAEIVVPPHTPENPSDFPEIDRDSTFWYGDISVTIEKTNKAVPDCPTLLWKIPAQKLGIDCYSTAVADFCYREMKPYVDELNAELYNRNKPREETGWYYMADLGGEVLERNTAYFEMSPSKSYVNRGGSVVADLPHDEAGGMRMCLCVRLLVQLTPKNIQKVVKMLCGTLPQMIGTYIKEFNKSKMMEVIALSEKQAEIRAWLKNSDYCAFIANDSILPRNPETGGPLKNAIPFKSPAEDEIDICGLKGMGIRKGVTVITGGGYSGKSTVLDTISACIYDHCKGDGRELCVTDTSAVTISAEDGRCVRNLDVSSFIKWLPGGDTAHFSTEHASGSTSQAANILEAVGTGAKLLLIDEDRSATNFMIRDRLMRSLISREPITPFTERVNELYERCGTSTILVIGGSGEYLSIADRVYLMDEYIMYNVTEKAAELSSEGSPDREKESGLQPEAVWNQKRIMLSKGFSAYPDGKFQEKLAVPDIGYIFIGDEKIDTNDIHNLLCDEQRTATGFMLRYLENKFNDLFDKHGENDRIDIVMEVDALYDLLLEKGLDFVYSGNFPECGRWLALPRKSDFLAVVYRMRNTNYVDG